MVQIMDDIAIMNTTGIESRYIEERGIFLRHINAEKIDNEYSSMGIYKAMKNTAWGDVAFTGAFANNDFSNVGKLNLKNYQPVTGWTYKGKSCYIYQKDGYFYFTSSRSNSIELYDLNRENDQKRFYREFVVDLRVSCMENLCKFEKYSFYDLLINYKQFFKV